MDNRQVKGMHMGRFVWFSDGRHCVRIDKSGYLHPKLNSNYELQ